MSEELLSKKSKATTLARQLALAVIAVTVVALLAVQGETRQTGSAIAQDSPLTPDITFTPTFTGTITPTISPTPTSIKRTANRITHPQPGNAVFGYTTISGSALVDSFLRYDAHISPAGMESWQWLITSYRVVGDGPIVSFDTTQFADGFYDIRVRAMAVNGTYTDAYLKPIEIRNLVPPTLTPDPDATATPASPLPTPTPAILSRIPGGQGFYAPDNGAILSGLVNIRATVNGTRENRYQRFELAISPAGLEQWTWLHGDSRQIWQDVIYTLDTTNFADGRYDLRLRIVYEDGNYSEFFLRNLSFANAGPVSAEFGPAAGIVSPRSGSSSSGMVDIVGTIPETDLLRWELSWSPGQRESWSFLVGGDQPASRQLIASLDLRQLPPGQYDFRLRIVRSDYNYSDYYVRNLQLKLE